MRKGIELNQGHCGRDGGIVNDLHLNWIDRLHLMLLLAWGRLAKMTLRVEVLLVLWVVCTEEVFEELIRLVLEDLRFFTVVRVVHNTDYRFINLEDLRHLSQLLACSDGLNFETVEVGISHDLLAIDVKETDLVSSHDSQTALNLPMLSGHSLQMSEELLADISPAPSLPSCDLIE